MGFLFTMHLISGVMLGYFVYCFLDGDAVFQLLLFSLFPNFLSIHSYLSSLLYYPVPFLLLLQFSPHMI